MSETAPIRFFWAPTPHRDLFLVLISWIMVILSGIPFTSKEVPDVENLPL